MNGGGLTDAEKFSGWVQRLIITNYLVNFVYFDAFFLTYLMQNHVRVSGILF